MTPFADNVGCLIHWIVKNQYQSQLFPKTKNRSSNQPSNDKKEINELHFYLVVQNNSRREAYVNEQIKISQQELSIDHHLSWLLSPFLYTKNTTNPPLSKPTPLTRWPSEEHSPYEYRAHLKNQVHLDLKETCKKGKNSAIKSGKKQEMRSFQEQLNPDLAMLTSERTRNPSARPDQSPRKPNSIQRPRELAEDWEESTDLSGI